MYLRAAHAEFSIPTLRQFIKDNPLGILITALQSANFPTIQCTHLPWVLDVEDEDSATELGVLRGHLARANPHSKALAEAAQNDVILEHEVSVIFNGPAHSYVTPKYYTDTKPKTGKVVPTWNYSAVQVYGKATVFFDPQCHKTSAFLGKQINDLSRHAERDIMRHTGGANPSAWEVGDAPAPYIEILRKSIIGIEIQIARLEGKYKMSQELGNADREGVIKGFETLKTDNALRIAETVKERGEMKNRQSSRGSNT